MASTLTLASRDLVEELAAELGHDPSAVHTVLLRILRKHGWHPAPEKELVQGHELRAKRKKAMS